MTFWRVNKYEFTADLVVYLKANAYKEDYSCLQTFTLYVSLDFCFDDRITYQFGSVSLKQSEHEGVKLDDYLIPVLGMREVNAAAEDLLYESKSTAASCSATGSTCSSWIAWATTRRSRYVRAKT